MEPSLSESVWRRAGRDWWEFFGDSHGQLAAFILQVLLVAAALLFPITDSPTGRFITIIAGEAVFIAATLAVFLVLAPSRQRDEARVLVREYLDGTIVFTRAFLFEGQLFVSLRNDGPTDSFSAQVISIDGLEPSRWAHPPWSIPWKGRPDEAVCEIVHSAEGVLHIGHVRAPAIIPEIVIEQNQVHYGSLSASVVGHEHGGYLPADRKGAPFENAIQAFEDAMRDAFRLAIRVSALSLKGPADAIIEITFPSWRPSKWPDEAKKGRLDADVAVRLLPSSETVA